MLRMKSLIVKGHRGVVDGPPLNFSNGGLILCGGNGTGKSSFVDSIEKVLTGRCGSLDTGDMGVSWDRHGTHINCASADVKLVLTDGGKEIPLSLGSITTPPDQAIRSLFMAAKQQSFLLRRRDILSFILKKPVDRYKAIESFLKVDDFVAFEQKLKDLQADCKWQRESCESEIREHNRALAQALKLPIGTIPTDSSCVTELNKAFTAIGLSPLIRIDEAPKRAIELDKLLEAFTDIEAINRLRALRSMVEAVPSPSTIPSEFPEFARLKHETESAEASLKGHFHAEVLETGLKWIREDDLATCPLCTNPIERDVVETHVSQKLDEHAGLQGLRNQFKNAASQLKAAIESYASALDRVERAWGNTTGSPFPSSALDVSSVLKNALGNQSQVLSSGFPIGQGTLDFEECRKLATVDLDGLRQTFLDQLDVMLRRYPDANRYEQLFNTKGILVAVMTHRASLTPLNDELRRLLAVTTQMNLITKHAENARKSVVQGLMDRVAHVADGYYRRIHPKEEIGDPKLTVPVRGSGSLDLTGSFHGKTGDPRGYYSEGHLDSLGLCFFLAIRRLHKVQCPNLELLILDDVMGTVDGDHRLRTAELIFEHFSDHQIFVTTHDRIWFEHLKAASSNKDCKALHIAAWSLTSGPVWGDHLSDYEWLTSIECRRAKPADQVIRAGRLLEEVLRHGCSGLQIAVPFRIKGDYTIDPLWTSFFTKVKKMNPFVSAYGARLDEIEKLRKLRNWAGAHFNEWALQLTEPEAAEFVSAVCALRTAVFCDACRNFIERISQIDGLWSCRCARTSYRGA